MAFCWPASRMACWNITWPGTPECRRKRPLERPMPSGSGGAGTAAWNTTKATSPILPAWMAACSTSTMAMRTTCLQHNFGHDSQGYCVSVFGAEGRAGTQFTARFGRIPAFTTAAARASRKGRGPSFFTHGTEASSTGWRLRATQLIWDPPVRVPAFQSTAEFTGNRPNRFAGNTIVAVSRSFVSSESSIQFSGNRYCAPKESFRNCRLWRSRT